MTKRLITLLLIIVMLAGLAAGCGKTQEKPAVKEPATQTSSGGNDTSKETDNGDGRKYPIPKGDWVIGLSNSYYGNTWRKQMVESFTRVAEEAKAAGLIKDYVIQNGDGSVNAQIAQINSFILEGVDAICINAASPTALNSVIDTAVAAGIPCIAFDSTVENDNAYCMDFDFTKYYEMR